MFVVRKYHGVILVFIFSVFFGTVNANAENPATDNGLELWDFDIKELEISYNENWFYGDTATIKLLIINESNRVASSYIDINLFSDNGRVVASNSELDIYFLKDMSPGETITRQITISDFDLSQFSALNVNITSPSQAHIFDSKLVHLDEFRPEKVNHPFFDIGIIIGITSLIMTIIGVMVRNSNLESFLPVIFVIPVFFIAGHIFGIPQLVSSLFFESLGLSFYWLAQEMAFFGIILGIGFALWLHIQLVRKLERKLTLGRGVKISL
ncbi:MAG: hypothetical protein OEX98_00050 [Nitrosopumilus sp.]|nr:hypothetical protein [Nitrosopumilus sp.]